MNPVLMDVLPFVRQGFCCSQLLMLLMLQARGEENPALVRSLQGLCHGIGHSEGDCGLLPGGACVLALLCGKGADEEVPHHMVLRAYCAIRRLYLSSGGGRAWRAEGRGRRPRSCGLR